MKVPHNCMRCLCHDCPKRADCLRYLAGAEGGSEEIWFSCFNPKYKNAATENCPFFVTNQKLRYGLGMKNFFDDVPARAASIIKSNLIRHFSRTRYYDMVKGARLITPEESEYIANEFKRAGIEEVPEFNDYVEEYQWP